MTASEFYIRAAEVVGTVLDRRPADPRACARELCGDDARLLREVLELLSIHVESMGDDPFGDEAIERLRHRNDDVLEAALRHAKEHKGAPGRGGDAPGTIGPYRVIGEIGRGGMGVVYECEQASPRRRVAVKVVDSLRNAAKLESRLRAEAQIQGRLQHPGIAQIYDAGIARIGAIARPYIVMELIDGTPLRAYAGDPSRSVRDQLELVASIADAMASAHTRGVIHRDLKPDNVLVLPGGQPKILDFGIARLVDDVTIAMTTMTQEGQILGTLAYMAPEQLSGKSSGVGPPADVYALGAMAYELLAGHPPIQLADMSLSAAFRAIELEEPIGIRRLNSSIDTDVETIISRCLCREPERRYSSAGELADDIRRYLCNRPIIARAPTRRYRTAKFVRRNRALVGGTVATVLTLVVGIIVAIVLGLGQHSARLDAERGRSLARQKELDAIRGVIRGASLLRGRTDTWEAVAQMHTIAPESRGWEWDHEVLKLPWILDVAKLRHEHTGGTGPIVRWFTGDREITFRDPTDGMLSVVDIATGEYRPVVLEQPLLHSSVRIEELARGEIGTVLRDGRIARINVHSGAVVPTGQSVSEGTSIDDARVAGTWHVLHDPPGLILRGEPLGKNMIRISGEGRPTVSLGENLPLDHSGPWWEHPVYAPGSPYIVLAHWGFEGIPPTLLAIDRRTHEIVGRAEASEGIPSLTMARDGRHVFVRHADGVEMRSLPDLEVVRVYDGVGGLGINMVRSPVDNTVAFVGNATGKIMLIGPDGTMTAFPELLNEDAFRTVTGFSPDGRLLLVNDWLLDVRSAISPDERAVTLLEGHASYVYQLAVSPDGSLLASAAPEGRVLLWDLERGIVLQRIDRTIRSNAGELIASMNSPLVFTREGDALLFAELHPETRAAGFTRVSLDDGSRTWTPSADHERTKDVIARAVGATAGTMLSHHCAVLPGERLLIGEPSVAIGYNTRVRDLKTGLSTELSRSKGQCQAGVAVHPEGHQYAYGEYPYRVVICDSATDEVVAVLPDINAMRVYGMAYSPDGSRLAIGTEDGQVSIYETEYYRKLADIRVPQVDPGSDRNYVFSLAWTPDGTRLVCAGGSIIRVLESERPVLRQDRRLAWEAELDEVRAGRAATEAARRVVSIERWAVTTD